MPLLFSVRNTYGTDYIPLIMFVSTLVCALLGTVLKWVKDADKYRRMLGKVILTGLVGGVFFLAFKFIEALAG